MVFEIVNLGHIRYKDYIYPIPIQLLGQAITGISLIWIPIFAFWQRNKNSHEDGMLDSKIWLLKPTQVRCWHWFRKGDFFNDKPPSSANRNGEDKRLMERLKYLEVPKKLHDTFLLMRDVLFCQINIFYRFIGGANHNDDQSTTMYIACLNHYFLDKKKAFCSCCDWHSVIIILWRKKWDRVVEGKCSQRSRKYIVGQLVALLHHRTTLTKSASAKKAIVGVLWKVSLFLCWRGSNLVLDT